MRGLVNQVRIFVLEATKKTWTSCEAYVAMELRALPRSLYLSVVVVD